MKILGPGGMALLKHWEKIVYFVYADQGGRPTGGLGHLLSEKERLYLPLGTQLDESTVNTWIQQDTDAAVAAVNKALAGEADSLTQNQFDALVCFEYNIGVGGFDGSTALQDVLAYDFPDVPDAMKRFNKVRINGQLVVSNGLINRRASEVMLWNAPDGTAV